MAYLLIKWAKLFIYKSSNFCARILPEFCQIFSRSTAVFHFRLRIPSSFAREGHFWARKFSFFRITFPDHFWAKMVDHLPVFFASQFRARKWQKMPTALGENENSHQFFASFIFSPSMSILARYLFTKWTFAPPNFKSDFWSSFLHSSEKVGI